MIRVVLDTNVLVSAFLMGEGNEWTVLDCVFKGELELVLSDKMLDEFKEVISRPKFGYTPAQVGRMAALLVQVSHFVIPTQAIDALKEDPDDDRVLECALEAGAEYIVSGDSHLLDLKSYNGIQVVSSKRMLEILGKK